MLDQFNSHAQIGISVKVKEEEETELSTKVAELEHGDAAKTTAAKAAAHHNRLADKLQDQTPLFVQIASVVGTQFHGILEQNNIPIGQTSFFACPLDEALVFVHLKRCSSTTKESSSSSLDLYNLSPYGSYPPRTGRQWLGRMQLAPLQQFWQTVAETAHVQVSMYKIWGDNAHHIVEASFKAFSRALRNLIDGVNTVRDDTIDDTQLEQLYGSSSDNALASTDLQRTGTVDRQTKETGINARLWLDGGAEGIQVSMGLPLLNAFWSTVSANALVSLQVLCAGDLWIDEHHTAEDVAIAVGQAWNQALGNKAGLNRMWCATVVEGTARVAVVLDLSNRPMLTHNLPLAQHDQEHLQDVPVEMLEHVLDSFVVNARMTLQVYVQPANTESTLNMEGTNSLGNGMVVLSPSSVLLADAWQGMAVALGRALRYCILVDSRRAGATASSKGTLSV